MIRAIETNLVERIASGQVIVDLTSALKELVENSIDAGATIVGICKFGEFYSQSPEIQLGDDGVKFFEVSDNGHGVGRDDIVHLGSTLCKHQSFRYLPGRSHCTSKLATFDDLEAMKTLGFRGEAFHGLCRLSQNVILSTRTASDAIGLQVKLDAEGRHSETRSLPMPVCFPQFLVYIFTNYVARNSCTS